MTRYNDDDDDDDPSPQGRIPSERWISSTTTSVEGGFIRTSSGRLVPTRGSSKSILDDPAGSDTLSTGPLEGEQLMDTSRRSRGSRLWNRLCKGNCMTNIAFILAITCFIAGATAILWVFTYNQSDEIVNQHSFRRHTDNKDVEENNSKSPPTVFTLPAPPYDLQEKCSPDHFLQTAEGLAICEMICGPATSCCISSNSSREKETVSETTNYYKYNDNDDNNNNDDAGDDDATYYDDDQQEQQQQQKEEPMIPSYYNDDLQEEEPMVPSYYTNDDDNTNKMEDDDDDDDDYVEDDFYNNGRRRTQESCYEFNKETCELYYEGCQHIYINGEIYGPP